MDTVSSIPDISPLTNNHAGLEPATNSILINGKPTVMLIDLESAVTPHKDMTSTEENSNSERKRKGDDKNSVNEAPSNDFDEEKDENSISLKKSMEGPSTDYDDEWEEIFAEADITIETVNTDKEFSPEDLIWVKERTVWYPGYVVKIYPSVQKASVYFINHSQSTGIKVPYSRLKKFTKNNYSTTWVDLLLDPNKTNEVLKKAIFVTKQYMGLSEEKLINETPSSFFARPFDDIDGIINKILLEKEHPHVLLAPVPVEEKPIEITEEELPDCCPTPEPEIDISERLSERDKRKLNSIEKVKNTENKKYIKFVKSNRCLDHLRLLMKEDFISARHNSYIKMQHDRFFHMDFLGIHPFGANFFGDYGSSKEDVHELISFLSESLSKSDFPESVNDKLKYIHLVLFPEALKHSIRVLKKCTDNRKLENHLKDGLWVTAAEKKAKRLKFS